MNLDEIPFDLTTNFDANLHEIPENPKEMKRAVLYLKEKWGDCKEIDLKIKLSGFIGSFSRILRDFSTAHYYLNEAIELSSQYGMNQSLLVNQIRQAHIFQWEKKFSESNALFEKTLEESKKSHSSFLDFVYQHAGKNFFDQGRYSEALTFFQEALSLRENKKNKELLDSTYLAIRETQSRLAQYS